MTSTSSQTIARPARIALVFCLVLAFLFPTGVQAAEGYSDMYRVYTITGVDKDSDQFAIAYLCGSPSNAPKDNYAVVIKLHVSGNALINVVDGEEFGQLLDNALSISQSDVSNLNEYLLSLGAPDDYLILNEKPLAVREIETAQAAGNTTANVKDSLVVYPDTLRYAAGKGITQMQFDTMYMGSVDVRLSLNPANATKGFSTMGLVVDYTGHPALELFRRMYANRFACVDLAQEGSFGTTVRVSAKIDLAGLNTGSLVFYSYNPIANTYKQLENTDYSIDGSYLYFSTDQGGCIMITDRALSKA